MGCEVEFVCTVLFDYLVDEILEPAARGHIRFDDLSKEIVLLSDI